jgi:cell division protein FtsL
MIAERERQGTRRRAAGAGTKDTVRTVAITPPVGAVESVRLREVGPMAERGSRPVRRARRLAMKSREAAAVVVAFFGVTLMCLYLAAYARVMAEGFEISEMRKAMRVEEAKSEALRAEISRLNLPESVRERAEKLGLVSGTPSSVNLVTQRNGATRDAGSTGNVGNAQ